MRRQRFFAVRVTIVHGPARESATRDYVRGEKRMGEQAFKAFAVGDLIQLLELDQSRARFSVSVEELYPEQVIANRKYNHTTH